MDKIVRKFKNHAEAEKADLEYYRSLTPEERLDILLDLIERGSDGASEGFKRVYRITKLERS